jgi:hypothetical protein
MDLPSIAPRDLRQGHFSPVANRIRLSTAVTIDPVIEPAEDAATNR